MPRVAWKKFYRMAEDAGYVVQIPGENDRADFRRGIKEKFGLDPVKNPLRTLYITHKDELGGSELFGDPTYLPNITSEVKELASRASLGQERIGFNTYHYHKSPEEIVAERLNANQGTLEFIDPFMYDKLVVLFWKKVDLEKSA